MFEQIGRMRGHGPSEQQTGRDETVQRRAQLRLRPAHHRGEQDMGKLAADCRRNLCELLDRAAESVEPRHERGIQAGWDRQCRRRNRGNRARDGGLASRFYHRLSHLLDKEGIPSVRSMMSCRMLADSCLSPTMRSIMALASCSVSRLMMRAVT